MHFNINKNTSKQFIVLAMLIILALILWNTTLFFERLKEVERDKMAIWAQSQKSFISDNKNDYLELNLLIATTNNIPVVNLGDDNTVYLHSNIPKKITENPEKFEQYIQNLKARNKPIIISLPGGETQYLYYESSPILLKLKYYPFIIILVIFLLGGVVYFFFRTTKISEQNKLWAGMAKETAHQIGTPLSSLIGWLEILRLENINPEYIFEMEKDISRLQTITSRFSKVGSIPSLKQTDIVNETLETFSYLKVRSSKLIDFSIETPDKPIVVELNAELYSWTIENLVKNAIDAMRGVGKVSLIITEDKQYVKIEVTDKGIGIHKRDFNIIFEPGYTSKTIGWGLGLSLAKRIINDYHNGSIKVKSSEINQGSTFQIALKKY